MYKHLSAPTLPEASQTVVARAEQIGDYELGDTLGVGAYAVYVSYSQSHTLSS